MTKHSFEHLNFLLSILRNAEELIDEAEILFQHRKLKRSVFLLLTSYEEIEKARALFNDPATTDIFKHDFKFKVINGEFRKVAEKLSDPDFKEMITSATVESLKQGHPEVSLEEIETRTRRATDALAVLLYNKFMEMDMKHMRGSCLYVDKNQKLKYETPSDMDSLVNFYNSFRPQLIQIISGIRYVISEASPVS